MAKKKKRASRPPSLPVRTGVVIRSTGSRSWVRTEDGQEYECVFRGRMRLAGYKTTNPVAVGDQVQFQAGEEGELGRIRKVLPRKNYILRRAAIHAHMVHVLCANVDQAILLYTLAFPHTTTGFANRFLLIAEAYHIPVLILINKVDLLKTPEEQEKLTEVSHMYREIGYPVKEISALDTSYKAEVEEILKDKVSFIGGHSGAGKSTLINMIDPELNIKTGEVSDYSQKGRHTTTFAEMHPLSIGGYIIDSPGIKEMGITNFEKQELAHYFPEMLRLLPQCRFNNCTHIQEPGCAVKEALENGEIHPSRYNSYLSMMDDLETEE